MGVRRGVRRPARDQGGPSRLLVRRPRHRPVVVERLHHRVEPALGQVARRLPLPAHPLPRHLGDLGRPVRLAQLGEQPAPLDAGELPVVAGKDHLGPGAPGLGQQLAGHAAVQHRRLVHHQHGPKIPPGAATVLDPEQRRVDRARLREPVRLQVLRYGVGRGQANHPVAGPLVRVPHGGQRVALPRAGPAFHQLQPAIRDRVLERGALVVPQRAPLQRHLLVPGFHALLVPRPGHRRPVRQRRTLLLAHADGGEASRRLARLAVVQRQHVPVPQHRPLRVRDVPCGGRIGRPVRPRAKMLGEVAVQLAPGEGGVVPRQRCQYLLRVPRRRLVRRPQRLGPRRRRAVHLAHPHGADVLARVRRRGIHPHPDAVLLEVAVLVRPPCLAPCFAVRHHGAAAGPAHLRVQVARLLPLQQGHAALGGLGPF